MPFDKAGKYQMNAQKARHADKHSGMTPGGAPDSSGTATVADEGKDIPHATMMDHGDGTGHTDMGDGSRVEHGNMEDIKARLKELLMQESGDDGGEVDKIPHAAMKSGGGSDTGDWA